jgi:hypothetical protein
VCFARLDKSTPKQQSCINELGIVKRATGTVSMVISYSMLSVTAREEAMSVTVYPHDISDFDLTRRLADPMPVDNPHLTATMKLFKRPLSPRYKKYMMPSIYKCPSYTLLASAEPSP